jgi:hypothetical protein
MARRTIIATSMLALATMCSPALATNYANMSPREAPQKVTSMHQSTRSFSSFDEAPFWTITPDKYRYHGGPKSTSTRPANDPFATMLLG